MIYIFNKQKIFLIIGLMVSQTTKSMNISGDLTPIKISSYEHCNEWPVGISGAVKIDNYDYTKNSVSTNKFFGDFNTANLVGAYILDIYSYKNDVQGFFLDNASRQLSVNKYLNYIEILKKYFNIIGCNSTEMLNFFDEYYLKGEQNIDFLDIFMHLKVEHYFKKLNSYYIFSCDEYKYLKKLPNKYTVDLGGKRMRVKKSQIELVLDIIKEDPKQFIDFSLVGTMIGGVQMLIFDSLFANDLTSEDLVKNYLFSFLIVQSELYITIGRFAIENNRINTIKTFECNPE